ncbi:YfiR/HmsC family protein [Thiorhodococcus minor]|uniref:YfiR family protein n=1 Tax=Thiorhodococcus minor TaxID=57489 RepID=A0A6M0K2I9_9GAMM|nr:YfiR family protein [Thiorhodococcus minor]
MTGRTAPAPAPAMGPSLQAAVRVLLLGLLIGAQILLVPQGASETLWREDAQRMKVGLKLFPASLAAVEALERRRGPDGKLLVLVAYSGTGAAAREAAAGLKSVATIRDLPLRVALVSAVELDVYAGDRPAAVFVASVGLEPRRLRAWSERQRALVFSPFADAVEEGAVAGVRVADRVRPSVNLVQARRAGIRFKPYFLEEAYAYEPAVDVELRASFLVNFALFIHWPSSAFDAPSAPLRYCVLGNAALSASLGQALVKERASGRPLRLADARGAAQWRRCHLLYIDHRAAELAPRVLAAVEGAPVLTVGDTEGLVQEGAMVSLVHLGGRLRPLINPAAAERVGIRISSKLLRIATLVSDSGGREP